MGEPGADAVSGALGRLLASVDFDVASPRSREFLRYVVEETVAGRAAQLSQVVIARGVFKRADDFDPGLDPIVRIQAVRLRRSLERYYLLSGAADPVRIELPRGGYVPVLRWATPAELPIRHPTPGPAPAHDRDDWPVVVVQAFDSSPQEARAAALLREALATGSAATRTCTSSWAAGAGMRTGPRVAAHASRWPGPSANPMAACG